MPLTAKDTAKSTNAWSQLASSSAGEFRVAGPSKQYSDAEGKGIEQVAGKKDSKADSPDSSAVFVSLKNNEMYTHWSMQYLNINHIIRFVEKLIIFARTNDWERCVIYTRDLFTLPYIRDIWLSLSFYLAFSARNVFRIASSIDPARPSTIYRR